MYQAPSISYRGAVRATLTAGPIFMIALGAATLYLRLPEPVGFEPAILIIGPTILLFALIFGPFISCIPVLLGTTFMMMLSTRCPIFEARTAWLLVGLGIGAVFSWATGAVHGAIELAFALTVTSGLSAWLCHYREVS